MRGYASDIVEAIVSDLNDRRGLRLDTLDEETQQEIKRTWISIVERMINPKLQQLNASLDEAIDSRDGVLVSKRSRRDRSLRLEQDLEASWSVSERLRRQLGLACAAMCSSCVSEFESALESVKGAKGLHE